MRYRYVVTPKNEVICISSFAKKIVKGKAICSPKDSFDEEIGKKLAMLRCDLKIAKKRYKSAVNKMNDARSDVNMAIENLSKASQYVSDSSNEIKTISDELKSLEAKLSKE